MTDDEANPQAEDDLAERLLEYDAVLAAGAALDPSLTGDLPEEYRAGFACLEMLERLRLSNVNGDSSGLAAPIPNPFSLSDAPTNDLERGTTHAANVPARLGKFEILRILGRGGCGVVFLAKDSALNRLVALKIPRPEMLLTPEVRQRFLREGRAGGCLDHPHLLPVFEAGEIGAVCYLASPYITGITLKEWLQHHGKQHAPRAAAKFMATLAEAMHYAHQKGIWHRDLKPSNILLQSSRSSAQVDRNVETIVDDLQAAEPKIIDFGLAKVFHETSDEALTRSGAIFGTPQYMAPEQAQGRTQEIGPATDIHALGVILYELLTGVTPYQGNSDLGILRQVIAAEPHDPARLCTRVSRDLATICLKCLEKAPVDRYDSMETLADDLQSFLAGRPILARPIGVAARSLKWLRRRSGAAVLAGLLLCAVVAVSVGFGIREFAHQADYEKILHQADIAKSRADERDITVRNRQYASQIRTGLSLKKDGQWSALRDLLLDLRPAPEHMDMRGFEWHYLWRTGQGFMVPELKSRVTAVGYSNSGNVCASGNLDYSIRLYDRPTGKPLAELARHGFFINTLDFMKDDTQLLSTACDKNPAGPGYRAEFILWSLTERKILRRRVYSHPFENLGHSVLAPAPAAGVLFAIDRKATPHRLLRLDLESGTERVLLTSENIHLVASSPQADMLAVVSYDSQAVAKRYPNFVELFDGSMRRVAARRFDKSVHMAVFSPSGGKLALGVGNDQPSCFVEIRDVPTLSLHKTLSFAELPRGLRFDWHGERLATLTGPSHFRISDVRTGNSLGSFKHDNATDMVIAFSPDGKEFAIGDGDGRIRAAANPFLPQDEVLPGPLPNSEAWCLAFAPDGKTLAVGYDHESISNQQTLMLWDSKNKKARLLPGHDATVMALAVSPDGKTLATASYDNFLRLWDMATGECLKKLQGHTGPVRALALSPDGAHIASAGSDLSIKIWNVNDGSIHSSWRGHDDMIRALAFSPQGSLLISAANDQMIRFWNPTDGTLVREIANEAKVQCLACSPDGLLLASGNESNKVEIWDSSRGVLVRSLPGHSGKVRSVVFSPDGKTLATGGEDKTVRLWNVFTGHETLVFPTEHFVNGLAFDSRSLRLAAALHDGSVRIWAAD